ncbi:hypothetical protein A3D66_02405 [Candidatus Kaiserbacteria bacterium RIFCSPHIGHO2_02_FULL_50_9]|uniref:Peptidyl-tRNA hydrolase n=1 Tax=Candidatus Kaiserbacteria bacterium RIFCSPLOWO2_01_FULL_51_21 TaxID=1798508 RepID=A0A1F6ECT8_9BACT|nr:MAG: hypothetical protein A3D66_02405 [Candidatus Kaiserbacteria bacterium RIFCSPHIGHO2_02_FULL_50_9]OGG71489.1 MAG: hypothetical protein A3A35_01810 [Candidatus Kaiserbacteria bacterium RIFCSPLOWO2_01_FULL_51_21]
MSYIVIGLGNPGEEYARTRHNAGRIAVSQFRELESFEAFTENKKYRSYIADGLIGKEKVLLLLPETFMNKSGLAAAAAVKSKKVAEKLIVVHDDLDLPLGKFKISFGRSSGGHRGVESIIRALKTKDFVRLRIGVSPIAPSGKLKKPKGEKAVLKFIIGTLSKSDEEAFKKVMRKIVGALHTIIVNGRERAMSEFNA